MNYYHSRVTTQTSNIELSLSPFDDLLIQHFYTKQSTTQQRCQEFKLPQSPDSSIK